MKKNPFLATMLSTLVGLSVGLFTESANAQTWSAVSTGMNDRVQALAVYNGPLYVGGEFTTAGGNPASRIAEWNGTTWSALGTGVNDDVYALTVYNSELYAGGYFTVAGGNPASCIAKWNGANWSAAGTGMSGGIFNTDVNALAIYGGELYAGGEFTIAGGNSANYIAKWNGATWSAAGTGISGGGGFNNTDVKALAVYNGDLYAGGDFDSSGGNPVNNIAKWDGTSWSALGTGVNDDVYALAVYNGDLYAGGYFTVAGGNPAICIAKWNGTTWAAVGTGMNNGVRALSIYNGELYAGGDFTTAGGNFANNIAKWNGTIWSALGTGTDNEVQALADYNGDLYAGGIFLGAGGIFSPAIARWNSPVGIEENSENNGVNIYPNPANNNFIIKVNSKIKNGQIDLFNLYGEKVYEETIFNVSTKEIQLKNISSGIYFVKMFDGEKCYCKKLIVEHD